MRLPVTPAPLLTAAMMLAAAVGCFGGKMVLATEPIDVYLVAGQSNAVGFDAPAESLPESEWDQKVMFWWRCGDPPPDMHDSMSEGWTTLRAQSAGSPIRPRAGRQYGNFADPDGGFGPEIGFARRLAKQSRHRVAIIKVAFSGTHAAGDWNPKVAALNEPATDHDSRGACYRSLISETQRAIASLPAGLEPRLVGLIWVQGESDASDDFYSSYRQHMDEMIASLREDLASPDLVALLAVNTAFKSGIAPHVPEIIKAQQAYCRSDPLARYVDTSGASTANDYHFDAAGTLEVGRRFAEALASIKASDDGIK